MPPGPGAFDLDALKRVEELYRKRLLQDAADAHARTGLAWCLFMQALYQAGQERILAALAEAAPGPAEEREGEGHFAPSLEQDSRELLGEALRQTIALSHLRDDPVVQAEVRRLHDLVRLTGRVEALSAVEEESFRVLTHITRAMADVEPPPKPPYRNKRGRRKRS